MQTQEDSQAEEIARLRAKVEELERAKARAVYLKVSDKGGISLYGMGRFPTTLYVEQWETILGMADEIRDFIAKNAAQLKRKP